jgi:hypothetical protein
MNFNPNDYWNQNIYFENSKINSKNIDKTINDIDYDVKKILICGRGQKSHPNFNPKFSTPSTNVTSELYVIADHSPSYSNHITRKGNYAISLITHPSVVKKILELNGEIYWFCPEFLNYDVPKIITGEFPKGNSGLAAISLASHLKINYILLSGLGFTKEYSQFSSGIKIVLENLNNSGMIIHSLDGLIAPKITFSDWINLDN